MIKVTYLFGAGASANALPVVKLIPIQISRLIDDIKRNDLWLSDSDFFANYSEKSKKGCQIQLLEDLQWLSNEASKHDSVDTFAKKLFLREDPELNRLKIALSIFFILEQSRKPVDMRYDAFLASILNENIYKFPNNVRILSWNYDYQFEQAFSGFSDRPSLSQNQGPLNIISKFHRGNPAQDAFSIVKLNGTTSLTDGMRFVSFTKKMAANIDIELLNFLVDQYVSVSNTSNRFYSMLSFAWEKWEPGEMSVIDKAIACTQDTEVLVVIGYSFPFFNREVDRKIIGAMKNLRKVYFQAPAPWHEKIRTRFQAIRQDIDPKNLVAYDEVESFLLPDELEL